MSTSHRDRPRPPSRRHRARQHGRWCPQRSARSAALTGGRAARSAARRGAARPAGRIIESSRGAAGLAQTDPAGRRALHGMPDLLTAATLDGPSAVALLGRRRTDTAVLPCPRSHHVVNNRRQMSPDEHTKEQNVVS